MNKSIISAAALAAFAVPAQAVETDVYLSGNIAFSASHHSAESGDTSAVKNNASRIGLYASAEQDGVRAFVVYERGFDGYNPNINSEDNQDVVRAFFGGVAGSYGTLIYGRAKSDYRLTGEAVDPFYNTSVIGFTGGFARGGANYGLSNLSNGFSDNALIYRSNDYSGLRFNTAVYVNDSTGNDPNDKHDYGAGAVVVLVVRVVAGAVIDVHGGVEAQARVVVGAVDQRVVGEAVAEVGQAVVGAAAGKTAGEADHRGVVERVDRFTGEPVVALGTAVDQRAVAAGDTAEEGANHVLVVLAVDVRVVAVEATLVDDEGTHAVLLGRGVQADARGIVLYRRGITRLRRMVAGGECDVAAQVDIGFDRLGRHRERGQGGCADDGLVQWITPWNVRREPARWPRAAHGTTWPTRWSAVERRPANPLTPRLFSLRRHRP